MKTILQNIPGALALLALLLLGACSNAAVTPTPARELTKSEANLVESDNTFGLDLFRRLSADKRDSNVFISPLSVSMALGMTLNGAVGETRDSMERTLALAGLTAEEINGSYRSLIDLLRGLDPAVQFSIANSIWYRQGTNVEQSFVDVNRRYFDAEVAGLDFGAPDAADRINEWVERNTNGKIDGIVAPPIPADVVMYLINAIYFKGSWETRFSEDSTRSETFTGPQGSAQAKLMYRSGSFRYTKGENYQAVDLPYGNERYSMLVVLPNEGTSVENLAASLSQSRWSQWLAGLHNAEGEVMLPRFKLEWKSSLVDVLRSMGMGIAFTSMADFSKINGSGGLYISDVQHKTFVEVNEEGTEAAAATSVEVSRTSLPVRFTMKMNRPFLVAIHERHSGSILFIGKIVAPTL